MLSVRDLITTVFKKRAQFVGSRYQLGYVIQILYKLDFDLSSRAIVSKILEFHYNPQLQQWFNDRFSDEHQGSDRRFFQLIDVVKGWGTSLKDVAATRPQDWKAENKSFKFTEPFQHTLQQEPSPPIEEGADLADWEKEDIEPGLVPEWEEDRNAPLPSAAPGSPDQVLREQALENLRQQYTIDRLQEENPDEYERQVQLEMKRIKYPLPKSNAGGMGLGQTRSQGGRKAQVQIDEDAIVRWVGWLIEGGFKAYAYYAARGLADYSNNEGALSMRHLTEQQWDELWNSGYISRLTNKLDDTLADLRQQTKPRKNIPTADEQVGLSQPRPVSTDQGTTVDRLPPQVVAALIPKMLIDYRVSWAYMRGADGKLVKDDQGRYIWDPDKYERLKRILLKIRDPIFDREKLAQDMGFELVPQDPEGKKKHPLIQLTEWFGERMMHGNYNNRILAPLADQVNRALQALGMGPADFQIPNTIKDPTTGQERQITNAEAQAYIDSFAGLIANKAMELDNNVDEPEWVALRQRKKKETKQQKLENLKKVNEQEAMRQEQILMNQGLLKMIPQTFNAETYNQFEGPPLQEGFHFGDRLSYMVYKAGKRTNKDDPATATIAPKPEPIFVPTASSFKDKMRGKEVHNALSVIAFIGKAIFVWGKKGLDVPRKGKFHDGLAFIVGVDGGRANLEKPRKISDVPPMLLVWSPYNKAVFAVQPPGGRSSGNKGGTIGNFMNDRELRSVDTGGESFSGYGTGLTDDMLAEDAATCLLSDDEIERNRAMWEAGATPTAEPEVEDEMGEEGTGKVAMATVADVVRRTIAQIVSNPLVPDTTQPFTPDQQQTQPAAPAGGEQVQVMAAPPPAMVQPGQNGQSPADAGGQLIQPGAPGAPQPGAGGPGAVQIVLPQGAAGNGGQQQTTVPVEVVKKAMRRYISKRLMH